MVTFCSCPSLWHETETKRTADGGDDLQKKLNQNPKNHLNLGCSGFPGTFQLFARCELTRSDTISFVKQTHRKGHCFNLMYCLYRVHSSLVYFPLHLPQVIFPAHKSQRGLPDIPLSSYFQHSCCNTFYQPASE